MSNHARNTAIFSALTLGSRITGMVRMMVFAYALGGRTVLADAYQLAYLIPSTIYEFIAGGLLSAVFIPVLVREQERSGKTSQEAWRVANTLMGAVAFLLALASAAALLLAPWIIDSLTALAEGNEIENKRALATGIFRFFAPQIVLLGINAVIMAILNSHSVFAVTAAAPIINNFVVIATFLAYRAGMVGPSGLAVGTTLGTLTMILVQLPWLLRLGMKIRPRFSLRDPVFASITSLGWPVALVSIANLIGWVIRTNLLNPVLGALTAYTLSFQLIMMPYGIFAVSIATVLYPALARHASGDKWSEFAGDMSRGLRWTMFIMFPVAAGLSILALPIARVLFEHKGGRFNYGDSVFTADFLGVYALSIVPYAAVMFLTRVFYALGDTRTPAAINIVGVFINAGFSYALLEPMGAAGIAAAAGITYVLTTVASLVMARRRLKIMAGSEIGKSLLKIAACTILMALVVSSADRFSSPNAVAIERGSRFPVTLPAKVAAQGTIIKIGNTADWKKFWLGLDRREDLLPAIDFKKEMIAVLVGPSSESTSSLTLGGTSRTGRKVSIDANIKVANLSTSATATPERKPAYLMALLKQPVDEVSVSYRVNDPAAERKTLFSWIDPEMLRLIALVLIGALTYVISAVLFRADELAFIARKLQGKLRRKASPEQ